MLKEKNMDRTYIFLQVLNYCSFHLIDVVFSNICSDSLFFLPHAYQIAVLQVVNFNTSVTGDWHFHNCIIMKTKSFSKEWIISHVKLEVTILLQKKGKKTCFSPYLQSCCIQLQEKGGRTGGNLWNKTYAWWTGPWF